MNAHSPIHPPHGRLTVSEAVSQSERAMADGQMMVAVEAFDRAVASAVSAVEAAAAAAWWIERAALGGAGCTADRRRLVETMARLPGITAAASAALDRMEGRTVPGGAALVAQAREAGIALAADLYDGSAA